MSKGKIAAEIGAGLVAAGAAAVAGYYYYGSKKAKQHRQLAAKWAGDMKKEVMREMKSLKTVNARDFAKIVDTVAGTYRGVRSINAADLKKAANELKANLKMVQQEISKTGRASLSRSKKTVKKITKKVVSKKRKSR